MSLTFWETIRGRNLADTLINNLPKIAEKRKQYTMVLKEDEVISYVRIAITEGERYVSHYKYGNEVMLIMEKTSNYH